MDKNSPSTKLSPPWITYVRQLNALFCGDPDVTIQDDPDAFEVKILVNGVAKANALSPLLPDKKEFGNAVLKISVVQKQQKQPSLADLVRTAFSGNPALECVIELPMPLSQTPTAFALFKPEVVQFYNDDISDPYGNANTIYQDIAEEVFKSPHDGIFFSTAPIKAEEVAEENLDAANSIQPENTISPNAKNISSIHS